MQTKNTYHTFGANSENRKEEIFTMKTLKKFSVISAAAAIAVMSTACGNAASTGITVISREDGSGTRSAFIELTGVEEKDADGNKTDKTTAEAIIANKTDVVLTQVAGDEQAIGYISLGSLNDTVKALNVDGVEATAENVKNGSYGISRPFNIATGDSISDAAQDFINFIMSTEGQKIVTDNKYIEISGVPEYAPAEVSGKVVVSGSSSVTPVMEKLAEAYQAQNSAVTVEVQQTDSSSGMKAAMEGTCDIGMASRDLKDDELSKLKSTTIAMDGIAIIVNNNNQVSNITKDQIKGIYTGEITDWSDIK